MVTAADWAPPATKQFTARSLHGLLSNAFLFAFQIWDYFVTVAGAHPYGYFTRFRQQQLERAELQQALAASELQAAKSQLHLHFLFDTLQGISAFTDADNRRAKAMPTQLRMRTSKTSPRDATRLRQDGFSQRPAGHNRTATFGHPLWSWWADQKMVALMLAGKMSDERRRCTAGN